MGLRTERTALNGDGNVTGTGRTTVWPVQAVYRAVGYFGSPLPGLPFDEAAGVIPNREGRVTGLDGCALAGIYTTGWIKRGPVGLIGHTKSDAAETIAHLREDAPALPKAVERDPRSIDALLASRGVRVVDWAGWMRLDGHERALGELVGRERIKVVPRDEMLDIGLGTVATSAS